MQRASDQESPKSWNEVTAPPLLSQETGLIPQVCLQERDHTSPREPLVSESPALSPSPTAGSIPQVGLKLAGGVPVSPMTGSIGASTCLS